MDERRWDALFEDVREESRRNRARYEELGAETVRVLRALVDEIRALADEIRDQRDEIRAQTAAQLRMLDRMSRFDPGDSAA